MIIRRQHTANFTTIGNKLFDDERLAADEVGVLAYLLSRPNNWEVRRTALMRRWGIGREAIRRIIRNLVRYGYCRAERKRQENGTTFVIYEIRDEPGPELTEDEAKRALALESSAAAHAQIDGISVPDDDQKEDDPLTGYPSPVGPPLAEPYPAYRDITNTDSTKDGSTQSSERERARAKEKRAINLAEFKRRWPTAASDDQARIDHAWFDLSSDEGNAALAGIPSFLAKLKADKRTTVPAGWKYLREKRWTLIDQAKPASSPAGYRRDSNEAKAILTLFDLARCGSHARGTMLRDGVLYYYRPVTPRMLALASAPAVAEWIALDRRQAAAWEGLLSEVVKVQTRTKLREGDPAPWPWPPKNDGSLYTSATGPPDVLMSEDDFANLK
jgi:hypothetical protein